MGKSEKEQNREARLNELLMGDYHRPINCPDCGGVMVFKGVGEYECEDCGRKELDDYGKVRGYVEKHRGATMVDVEKETGVKQKAIRKMLREERIEVAADSRTFLRCEVCGADIRSGRFCEKCKVNVNRRIEEQARAQKNNALAGFGLGNSKGEEGERRFIRSK
ncbi:MAG: hypothetical protein NC254_14070 [bacterium]|nr:hypothetical protein [bacterium]